jgi:hypothetical protein
MSTLAGLGHAGSTMQLLSSGQQKVSAFSASTYKQCSPGFEALSGRRLASREVLQD